MEPIEVGVHVRSFYSVMRKHDTRDVLEVLRGDPRVLNFLERYRLGRLEFSDHLPGPDWRGSFDPNSRDIVVNPFRSPDTYGKQFYPPELPSVSDAGRNLVEAMQRTLYHELGHLVLDIAGPEVGQQVRRLFRSGRVAPVSLRAIQGYLEYFCETFTAYRFEDGLADKDPNGYHMIEAVIRSVFK